MAEIALNTNDEQLHSLQHAVNEAREGSQTIRVDKEALRRLLLDHYLLNGASSKRGHTTTFEVG